MKDVTCYGLTRTRACQQEWYDTASRDAGQRARNLRKQGFRVFVEAMGGQVTSVGRVAMTLVSILAEAGEEIPAPVRLERV